MATALATRDTPDTDLFRVARAFAQSGYFKDTRDEAQAIVRILAGREMGFGPFASMSGVHIIEGKPSVSAGLMATAIENSGRYGYSVAWEPDEQAPTACAITFYRLHMGGKGGRTQTGVSRFTLEDAQRANLAQKQTWKQYTRNMLFSRAMSNGARWYCAGVFGVGAVYTPEELGAEVDEDGSVVQAAQPAPVIRMVDPLTAEVRIERVDYPKVALPAEPPKQAPALDYTATLTWLQKLPADEARGTAQRDALARLVGKKLPAEAARYGLELPARTAEMDPASWAVIALMRLAERDDSSPF